MIFGIPCGPRTFLFIMKEFKTIDEQIKLLKSRGIVVNDEKEAYKILITNNYYNIINGYKDIFLDDNGNYIKNTSFEEIYALYEFDRALRNIFLEFILKIENMVRSLVAYYFSKSHGNENYLILNNFEIYENVNVPAKTKEKQLKHIQNLIGTINKKIANAIESKPYINHYIINHGFIPMWVLVNILSFGDISNFFKLMKQKERIKISSEFNIMEFNLSNLISILAYTRNLCAHDERLYNCKFPTNKSIDDNKIHELMNIKKENNNRYSYGKNDLFAVVISLKLLLSEKDYEKFHSKIFSRIMSLQSKLKVINISDVLKTMNFPYNWHDIKKCPKSTRDT